ncbi:HAMP domain-containing histidine kinase [Candidatus Saccharibacteria bacterium]|nr:HAMP domain-containing histidine kinase [Candidatus Saccharibacteria bacterium]
MAVKEDPPILSRISDFYGRLFSRSWLELLLSQVMLVGLIIVVVVMVRPYFDLEVILIATALVLILLESVLAFMFLKRVLQPTDLIARALVQISGERSTLPPPDRNNPRYKKSGLKLMLDKLYELDEKAKACEAQTLPASEQLLRNLLAALPIGFIALDGQRKIIASNELAPTYFPEKDHRAIQLDFTDMPDSLNGWLGDVEKNAVESEKFWARVQNDAPGKDDRKIYDVLAHYKKDAASGIETIIITVDRTQEYLENESSMDFIALAAHELRGPITVIRGYLDILDEQLAGQLTPDKHELIDRLNVSANRLSAYVNNILNASRYDRRHLQLQLSEMTINNIISDIRDDMELRARTLNRQLSFQIPDGLPSVAADRSSVSEVLSNLIDNAIKYSRDGGHVEVSAAQDDDFVAIKVRDWGVGIPTVVAQHLFSKFYRSHRSRGTISGSGLGLYISRAIVESHGGHISVESREGEGSTFTFTLPIFSTVADKLATTGGDNADLIRTGGNWIRNHGTIKD